MTHDAPAQRTTSKIDITRALLLAAGIGSFGAAVGIWAQGGIEPYYFVAVITWAAFWLAMVGGLYFDRVRSRAAMAIAFLVASGCAIGPMLFLALAIAGYLAGALAGRRLRSLQWVATGGIVLGAIVGVLLLPKIGMLAVAALSAAAILLGSIEGAGERPALRQRLVRAAIYGTLTVIFAVTVGLPWALSTMVTKAGTRRDERARTDDPSSLGATFEDVSFESHYDGITFSGWYLPSAEANVTIVMSHGLFRSRYELLERGVDLWKLGYNVLLYDLRRHGKSTGEFCTLGYEERNDVLAAVSYVRSRAPGGKVVLLGVSMGAAATLLAAAELDDVSAVIADSSFLSLRHTVYHHVGLTPLPSFPFAPVLLWATALRMNYSPSDFDVLAAVRGIACPILFIGGEKDVRMPTETVLNPLFEAAPNSLKRRLVIEGATHGHAYETSPEAYVSAVDSFISAAALAHSDI